MKKKEFIKIMEQIEMIAIDYFAVIVDLGFNEYELIVNTIDSFEDKFKYYLNEFDDNMYDVKNQRRIVDLIGSYDMKSIVEEFELYKKNVEYR